MPAAPSHERSVDLVIGGMTCASCAARVEKKLNRLDGVTATVNDATERRTWLRPRRCRTRTSSTVWARPVTPSAWRTGSVVPRPTRPLPSPGRLLVSLVLTLPVVGMAMVSALQVGYWQWISLVLATPVVLWGG